MDRKKAWLVGVAAVATMSAGTFAMTAGPALAATCAPGGTTSCVAISYQNPLVKSIRVNGRCLINGGTAKYPNTSITSDVSVWPTTLTYGGTRCEGNTQNTAGVWWGGEDSDGFRWVTITRHEG